MKRNAYLLLFSDTLLTLFFFSTAGYSQVASQHNNYRCGDRVVEKQIGLPQQTVSGTHKIWDISCQALPDDDYIVEYNYVPDTTENVIGVTEQDTRYFYELQGNSLLLNGFENRQTRMEYDLREVYLQFPIIYGDSLEGFFHGTGRNCDRLGLRSYGRYKTKADEIGDLVIAEGDTLHQVLKLHTERIQATEFIPIEMLDSLPVYPTDSIAGRIAADTTLIRIDICRWYAQGFRYPILETRKRYDGNSSQPLSVKAYYYPPQAHSRSLNNADVSVSQIEEMPQRPVNTTFYSIDGRQKTVQPYRNSIYIKEQHHGCNKTTKKITVNNR